MKFALKSASEFTFQDELLDFKLISEIVKKWSKNPGTRSHPSISKYLVS